MKEPTGMIPCSPPTRKNFQDLTGRTYSRLTVLSLAGKREAVRGYTYYWLCRCECGELTVVAVNGLKYGGTRSCGCLSSEVHSALMTTHGMLKAPEYHTYTMMLQRVLNPTNKGYKNYGGRGITVCERWRGVDGFKNFLEDMGRRPAPHFTIERQNNDGNYEPSNCHWATRKEQGRNRRSNVLITFNGKTMCISEWAEELGMDDGTIHGRLRKGWPIERVLSKDLFTRCGNVRGSWKLRQAAKTGLY